MGFGGIRLRSEGIRLGFGGICFLGAIWMVLEGISLGFWGEVWLVFWGICHTFGTNLPRFGVWPWLQQHSPIPEGWHNPDPFPASLGTRPQPQSLPWHWGNDPEPPPDPGEGTAPSPCPAWG